LRHQTHSYFGPKHPFWQHQLKIFCYINITTKKFLNIFGTFAVTYICMEYKKKKVNNKKQIKVLKYEEHPEFIGNEIEVAIINNEKTRPIVKKPTPDKPKQPRMTINQLAIEMRAGFAAVNQRMDIEFAAVNQRMGKIENEIGVINKRIDNIEDVLKRNNLK
jgi:hypothetical protein